MGFADIDDRGAVLAAIAEFDRDRRISFLARYEFKVATGYLLVHQDPAGVPQRYDSKAIVARAHYHQHGRTLRASEFSGGLATVVRLLRSRGMGFRVIKLLDDWADEDLVLVLHWYLCHRPRKLRAGDPETRGLAKILEELVLLRNRPEVARFREPADVMVQLEAFGSLEREKPDRPNQRVKQRHRELWTKYADDDDRRVREVRKILDILDRRRAGLAPPTAEGGQVAAEQGAGGYGPRARKKRKPTKPYQGRRKISSRRAAKLREDDPEKYDRSNQAHEDVRCDLATYLETRGFDVEDPASDDLNFDLGAVRRNLRLVIEVKSLPENNPNTEAQRIRLGLGQVLWYRRRFWTLHHEHRVAVLAVEHEPQYAEEWLDVCRSVGVVLTWPERKGLLLSECASIQQGRWRHTAAP